MDPKYLWLVDANNLIHRYYHSPSPALSCKCNFCRPCPAAKNFNPEKWADCSKCQGTGIEQTKATYAFTQTLLRIIGQNKPDYLAVIFDGPRDKLIRRQWYPEYKANRPPTDPSLVQQIKRCKQISKTLGICTIECLGYESDDAIATLATSHASKRTGVRIVSRDKDLAALLLSPFVALHDPQTRETLGADWCLTKFGVTPDKMTDYLVMVGDSADNIPGLKGIGPKTAVDLLNRYGSLIEVLKHPQVLPKALRGLSQKELLDMAMRSARLVALDEGIAGLPRLHRLECFPPDLKAAGVLFRALGFASIIDRMERIKGNEEKSNPVRRS